MFLSMEMMKMVNDYDDNGEWRRDEGPRDATK